MTTGTAIKSIDWELLFGYYGLWFILILTDLEIRKKEG